MFYEAVVAMYLRTAPFQIYSTGHAIGFDMVVSNGLLVDRQFIHADIDGQNRLDTNWLA